MIICLWCKKTDSVYLDKLIRYQNNKHIFTSYCYSCTCGHRSGFVDSEQEALNIFCPKPAQIIAEDLLK